MPLRPLAPELWTEAEPMRFYGLPIGRRVTVVRLASGQLAVFSPLRWSAARQAEWEALGPVALMVVPNRWHDRYFDEYFSRLPHCRWAASAGVRANHVDWPLAPLEECADLLGEFDRLTLPGLPSIEETVFRHRPTRTLIVADLLFNVGPGAPPLTRLLFALAGLHRPGPSRLERWLIRDRAAFAAAWEQVLGWEIDRICVGHGEVIQRDAAQVLREAYAFLRGHAVKKS